MTDVELPFARPGSTPPTPQTAPLEQLTRHGLLSTGQLSRLCTQPLRTTQRQLKHLRTEGLVDRARRANQSSRWFLTADGRAAAGGDCMEVTLHRARHFGHHLLGINEFGVRLVEAARDRGDGSTAVSWDHERPYKCADKSWVTPDSVVDYVERVALGMVHHRWMIEFDCGTETISRLVDKVLAYRDLQSYRVGNDLVWPRHFVQWPPIVFVFDCRGAKSRMETFAAQLRSDPRLRKDLPGLKVHLVDFAHFIDDPAGAIYLRVANLEHSSLLVEGSAK